jgi:site-specific DNA recombinase
MKNAKETPVKYFLYARKSTESEDRQVLSIESQIDELKAIADRENIKIIEVLHESRSAKALGRPIFNDMIGRINRGEATGILCWKLDRLARNFIDAGKIIEMLQHSVIRHIRSYEKSYYPQDNVLMMSLEFGVANQFSRDLAVNVNRGMKKKAEMGWYPVQPPIGYLNSRIKGKGKNDISKDPERFDIVRKIFDLMLTGTMSAHQVWLTSTEKWGLRTRKDHKLCRSSIYYVLTNPFYYGMFEYPRGSGTWYKGAHQPMITEEEFDRIQILLGRKGKPRPKSHIFDFTGMLRCGECGGVITAEEKIKRPKNGKIHHYIYYHCTKRIHPDCTQGSIEVTELKKQIVKKIESLEIPPEFHTYALKWFRKKNENDAITNTTIISAQHKAYDTCVRKINGLIDMRAAGEITLEEFTDRKTPLMKEKARLEELFDDTGDRVNKQVQDADDLFTFLRDVVAKFNNGGFEVRKRILSTLGQNLLLKDKILSIDWEKSLLPSQKLAAEVKKIHERLEPTKNKMSQGDLEEIYSKNPMCAPSWSRTNDPLLKRELLYQLSYGRVMNY